MESKKLRYRATIAGKTYTILGKKSHQHMKSVEKLLNEQLDQLTALSPHLSLQEKSILLAINAISQQLDLQQELEGLKSQDKKPKLPTTGQKARIHSASQAQLDKIFEAQSDLLGK